MVQQYKLDKVNEISELVNDYSVVGIIDMYKLPASQLHTIKRDLRNIVKVVVVKKRLIKFAFEKSNKKDIVGLLSNDVMIPALVFTKESPFKLYASFKKNKAEAYAKPGDKAPYDIIVPEGETNLAPGPIIGILQKAKIKARIQGDKIVISEDSLAVEEGGIIDAELSSILMQLGIKPMEIGLNLVAVYENGTFFDKKVLDIDVDGYISDISLAHSRAINLAVNAVIPVKDVMLMLIGKAHMNSLNLAVDAGVVNSGTVAMFISKAQAHMNSLASVLPEGARGRVSVAVQQPAAPETKKEEKKEEKKKEEEKKPEEAAAGLGALFG